MVKIPLSKRCDHIRPSCCSGVSALPLASGTSDMIRWPRAHPYPSLNTTCSCCFLVCEGGRYYRVAHLTGLTFEEAQHSFRMPVACLPLYL